MRDHVGQLHGVLRGQGCCVVLEGHYLASFMRHYVCLRRLRIADLFRILSLGRHRLHNIQRIIPRLLIIIHRHHHILLSRRLLKKIQEGDVTCVR